MREREKERKKEKTKETTSKIYNPNHFKCNNELIFVCEKCELNSVNKKIEYKYKGEMKESESPKHNVLWLKNTDKE